MDAKEFLKEKRISNNDFMDSGVADLIETLLTEYQSLQLQQAGVSGRDIFQAVDEAMSLIDYMHQLTVIPDNILEDYANKFANTMHLLAEVRHHYR